MQKVSKWFSFQNIDLRMKIEKSEIRYVNTIIYYGYIKDNIIYNRLIPIYNGLNSSPFFYS